MGPPALRGPRVRARTYGAVSHGDPVYGPRDTPDFARMAALGLPFWIAVAARAGPEQVRRAGAVGVAGVQVGGLFAFCEESGLEEGLRRELIECELAGGLTVRNDPGGLPGLLPVQGRRPAGTLADAKTSAARTRVCDLGCPRTPYRTDRGTIGYRRPAEPVAAHVRKGGTLEETEGRPCLCNGLLAAVGLGRRRPRGRGRNHPSSPSAKTWASCGTSPRGRR
ncbi:hypothetical protein SHIRM173S_01974 [Streptomyces hirsutus]